MPRLRYWRWEGIISRRYPEMGAVPTSPPPSVSSKPGGLITKLKHLLHWTTATYRETHIYCAFHATKHTSIDQSCSTHLNYPSLFLHYHQSAIHKLPQLQLFSARRQDYKQGPSWYTPSRHYVECWAARDLNHNSEYDLVSANSDGVGYHGLGRRLTTDGSGPPTAAHHRREWPSDGGSPRTGGPPRRWLTTDGSGLPRRRLTTDGGLPRRLLTTTTTQDLI